MSTPTRGLHDNLSSVVLIAPATAQAADSTLISVDLLGYRACVVNIWVGVGGITFSGSNKVEFVLEHSLDNTNWAVVTQADVSGATVAAGGIVRSLVAAKAAADATATEMSYIGGRRYIRLLADFTGTHGAGTPMVAWATRGLPEQMPTT